MFKSQSGQNLKKKKLGRISGSGFGFQLVPIRSLPRNDDDHMGGCWFESWPGKNLIFLRGNIRVWVWVWVCSNLIFTGWWQWPGGSSNVWKWVGSKFKISFFKGDILVCVWVWARSDLIFYQCCWVQIQVRSELKKKLRGDIGFWVWVQACSDPIFTWLWQWPGGKS